MCRVRIENGVVVGTSGGKYELRNPIARYLLAGFDRALGDLVRVVSPRRILEVGCGEGHVTRLLWEWTSAKIHATDISETVIKEAQAYCPQSERLSFEVVDIRNLKPLSPRPDLVVCCEVLEHLEDPIEGLRCLQRQQSQWYLLSVPREPLWRALNMLRGAYLRDFGNSPGHLQHWNRKAFLRLLQREGFMPLVHKSPVPWTIALCRGLP